MSIIKCECEEIWKDILGYPKYQISSKGNVFSKNRKRNLKHTIRKGYHRVHLCKNGKPKYFTISFLVGEYFIPNVENKLTVDHKNGDKDNNCVCNLQWANISEQNRNQKISSKNTSGYKNIHPVRNKWKLVITVNKNQIFLGYFDCLEIAVDLRNWYYKHILGIECIER